jgi:uncharacterized FlaG/YvyC family protein
MAHKLQELFHELANKINTMNNIVSLPAVTYLNKDLKLFSEEEKKNLLNKLDEALEKASDAYQKVIDAETKVVEIIPPNSIWIDVSPYFDEIMDIIHDTRRKYTTLMVKIDKYKSDMDFESYITPILQEALEFDKKMAAIAELLEKAKDVLRKKGLYPKPGEDDA